MAIVTPGKRPCDRIASSKVLGKKFARGKKATDATFMLTSLVDMFMIIVIFLLQNFSATGEILFMAKDIRLPDAVHGAELERAPVIAISNDAVTFEGKQLVMTTDLTKAEGVGIPELDDALRDERRKYEASHSNDPQHPFKGLVHVQADRKIAFKVIKRVMQACNSAGYGNINFAALAKTTQPTATASLH
jgi:biopolymer transport protein ExbD